jgi:hypothetical protein
MSNPQVNSTNVSSRAARTNSAARGNSYDSGTGKIASMFKKIKTLASGKTPIILLIIGVVLLFIIVILYILFMTKSAKLKGKKLTSNPIKLDTLTAPIEIESAELPKSVVGREYSFSFWVYIENYDQTFTRNAENNQITPLDKMIFYRGTAGNISSANPIVTMDGLSNKMYIAIKTQNSTLTSIPGRIDYNSNLYNIRFMNYFMNSKLKIRDTANPDQPAINKYIILTIDYIPLQRWVNVTFIIDNKISTVYMDGEIYSVKSTEEFKAIREPELDVRGRPVNVNIIVDKTDNNVYIGKNQSVGGGKTIPGYLGKLQFFNYALALNDVKNIYNQGPLATKGWFSGSVNYALRNPVYKLDKNL